MNQEVQNIANKILMSVGEPFLTQQESGLLPSDPNNKDEIYHVLFEIMKERKSLQASLNKLQAKATLDGVQIPLNETRKKYGSNILLGFGVNE